jgi:hypothetical protein
MDRIFVEFADGSWVTTDNPDFQTDLAEMVAQSGRPVLVEFRAAGEGYVAPTPCEDCGLAYAKCRCDGYDPDAKPEPTPLGVLSEFYLGKYGRLLDKEG